MSRNAKPLERDLANERECRSRSIPGRASILHLTLLVRYYRTSTKVEGNQIRIFQGVRLHLITTTE